MTRNGKRELMEAIRTRYRQGSKTVWITGPEPQSARKTTRLAQRTTSKPKTALPGRQKTANYGSYRLKLDC